MIKITRLRVEKAEFFCDFAFFAICGFLVLTFVRKWWYINKAVTNGNGKNLKKNSENLP